MNKSARTILLRYFGMLVILFGLLGFSLYSSIRRSRVTSRAMSTCITTTVVIATSMNKLAIIFLNPAISEASNNLGQLP